MEGRRTTTILIHKMTRAGLSTPSGSSTYASAKQKNGTSKALSCYSDAIVLSRLLVNPQQHNSSTCWHSLYLAVKTPHNAQTDLSLSQAVNKGQHNVNKLKTTGTLLIHPCGLSCSIRCGPQQPTSQVKVKALCWLLWIIFFPMLISFSIRAHYQRSSCSSFHLRVIK